MFLTNLDGLKQNRLKKDNNNITITIKITIQCNVRDWKKALVNIVQTERSLDFQTPKWGEHPFYNRTSKQSGNYSNAMTGET